MIEWVHDGQGGEWGTAAQIARHLGCGVTHSMIRTWARHYGLRRVRIPDDNGRPQVLYPVRQAAEIDKRMQDSGRGRGRTLDTSRAIDHTAR